MFLLLYKCENRTIIHSCMQMKCSFKSSSYKTSIFSLFVLSLFFPIQRPLYTTFGTIETHLWPLLEIPLFEHQTINIEKKTRTKAKESQNRVSFRSAVSSCCCTNITFRRYGIFQQLNQLISTRTHSRTIEHDSWC